MNKKVGKKKQILRCFNLCLELLKTGWRKKKCRWKRRFYVHLISPPPPHLWRDYQFRIIENSSSCAKIRRAKGFAPPGASCVAGFFCSGHRLLFLGLIPTNLLRSRTKKVDKKNPKPKLRLLVCHCSRARQHLCWSQRSRCQKNVEEEQKCRQTYLCQTCTGSGTEMKKESK